MGVLGVETSCDERGAGGGTDSGQRRILGDRVLSQLDKHRPYGGVVPEIAARAHLEALDGLIIDALAEAGLGFADLDAVAFTGGARPLRGGVLRATGGAWAAPAGLLPRLGRPPARHPRAPRR